MALEIVLIIIGFIGIFLTVYFLQQSLSQKAKIDSASFIFTQIEAILQQYKHTINTLHDRRSDKSIKFKPEHDLKALLGRLENVIFYMNDGILNKEYVLERLGTLFKLLEHDDEVHRIICETKKDFPTAYEDFERFMRNN